MLLGARERWVENPYYQLFCGEEFFCHKLPFDRSSLRWRQRMGLLPRGLCGPEVTSSVFGKPCLEFAAAGGSNGSSCTVPSVIRVVLMPVSGSKWIDRTADSRFSSVAFGLAATFALFGVKGFSAVSTGADNLGRAAPGCSGSARGTKAGMASLRPVGSRATRVRSAAAALRPVCEPAAGPAGGEDDRTRLRRACASVASRWAGKLNTRARGFEARSASALSHAA